MCAIWVEATRPLSGSSHDSLCHREPREVEGRRSCTCEEKGPKKGEANEGRDSNLLVSPLYQLKRYLPVSSIAELELRKRKK